MTQDRDVVLVVVGGRRIGTEVQYFSPGNFGAGVDKGHIQAWVVIYPVKKG